MADHPSSDHQLPSACRSSIQTAYADRLRLLLLFPLALLPHAIAGPSAVVAAERGYEQRACGFDLDFDGISGEAADCNICDGTTTDVDGNGVQDALFYVDAGAGTNNGSCGSSTAPCRSISYALFNRLTTPAAQQIQAICLKGTTSEAIDFQSAGLDGASGFFTRPKKGTQVRPFQYPRYPLVLTAWDTDNDGVYSDETAVVNSSNSATELRVETVNRLEVAHLRFQGGNGGCSVGVAFIDTAPGNHQYFHDLVVEDYARGCGEWIGVEIFGGALNHFAVEYVNFDQVGGAFWWRGAPTGGPYRWQHNTVTIYGPSNGAVEGMKIWDMNEGFEVLDSVWDANPAAWGGGEEWGDGLIIAQCSRDWDIINNEIAGWEVGIILQPSAGFEACSSRSLDDITIDRNIIRGTRDQNRVCNTTSGIFLEPGEFSATFVEDVAITNNFFSHPLDDVWQAAIRSDVSRSSGSCTDLPGVITIVNNTFHVDTGENTGCIPGVIRISTFGGSCRQQDYVVRNNVFAGTDAGDDLIFTDYNVSGFVADNNTYGAGGWVWNGSSRSTLSSWRSALGGGCPSSLDNDCSAKSCTPSFVAAGVGDLHLTGADTCAREGAQVLTAITTVDVDSQNRGSDRWDIGADEYDSLFLDGFESGDVATWDQSVP